MLSVDINTLLYQVPGGMLSNLMSQLKQDGQSDKLIDVLAEVPRVREDFGYPPLVTPTSQIVGTQAVLNVVCGQRYKTFTKESRGLLRGEYGRLPAPVNEDVRKKAIGDQEVITCRPADLLKPELEHYRKELASILRRTRTYSATPCSRRWRRSSLRRARLLSSSWTIPFWTQRTMRCQYKNVDGGAMWTGGVNSPATATPSNFCSRRCATQAKIARKRFLLWEMGFPGAKISTRARRTRRRARFYCERAAALRALPGIG